MDGLDSGDEIVIRGLLAMGREANSHLDIFFAEERKEYASKGLFKEKFEALEEAIDLHRESVLEVEHIIFELRKEKDFMALCDSIADL